MEIKKAKILCLWFHKFKKHTESMIRCTAATLSLVWKFTNHWSKQRGCCCLSGDMKGRKMEPRQRAVQAGMLSIHSGRSQFCYGLRWRNHLQHVPHLTSLCARWPGFLHYKSHRESSYSLALPFPVEDCTENNPGGESRQCRLCTYLFIAIINS